MHTTPEARCQQQSHERTTGEIGLVRWHWDSYEGGTYHLMGIDERCVPHFCCVQGDLANRPIAGEAGKILARELEALLNEHGAPGQVAGVVCAQCYDLTHVTNEESKT